MNPSSRSTLASATFSLVAGISTNGRSMVLALRMRVSMSAIGSVIMAVSSPRGYQDALRTPGIIPSLASLRKQIRQTPNLRYTARPRPHNLQRRRCRVENFGGRSDAAIFDLLAMGVRCQDSEVFMVAFRAAK